MSEPGSQSMAAVLIPRNLWAPLMERRETVNAIIPFSESMNQK